MVWVPLCSVYHRCDLLVHVQHEWANHWFQRLRTKAGHHQHHTCIHIIKQPQKYPKFWGKINQAAQIKETRGHFALDTRIPTKGKSIVAHTDHITAQFIANTSALLRDQFTIVAVRHTFRAGEYSRNILFEYFVSLLAL